MTRHGHGWTDDSGPIVLPTMAMTLKQRRAAKKSIYQEAQRATQGTNAARYGWTKRMINTANMPDPSKDGVMSWSFARAFDFEIQEFTHIDMPGSVRVAPTAGRSQVVRTDTTDRLQRNASSVRRQKLSLMGD